MRRGLGLCATALIVAAAALAARAGGGPVATNVSYPTIYEEEDNVHIALRPPAAQRITSFTLEARQPTYAIGIDHTEPGRFPPPGNDPAYPFANPGAFKLYDDGTTVIVGVRESTFWRPEAMTARVGQSSLSDIHYLQVYRKIAGVDSWPQFAVIYCDSNIRLKPQPQLGRVDQAFGSSIIVGPADDAQRPAADIASIEYIASADRFDLSYRDGGHASIDVQTVNRDVARLQVKVDCDGSAVARLRSMFVAAGDSDVDHVRWVDANGLTHNDPIMAFAGGQGSEFLFTRDTWSVHNTSAPDIWVGNFSVVPEPSGLLGLLPLVLLVRRIR